jgi:hypothetical protein
VVISHHPTAEGIGGVLVAVDQHIEGAPIPPAESINQFFI